MVLVLAGGFFYKFLPPSVIQQAQNIEIETLILPSPISLN